MEECRDEHRYHVKKKKRGAGSTFERARSLSLSPRALARDSEGLDEKEEDLHRILDA